MNTNNTPLYDLLAPVALKDALGSSKESPWYGFYNLVFQLLSRDSEPFDTAILYPQLLITCDEWLEQENSDDEEDKTPDSPSPVPRTNAGRSLTLEPGESSPARAKLSAGELVKIRSSRIPDFGRRRYYLDTDRTIISQRLDLLVEIKKFEGNAVTRQITRKRLMDQLNEQAAHAFSEDPLLPVISCFGAIGHRWVYYEIRRETRQDIKDNKRDGTYEPDSDSSSASNSISSSTSRRPSFLDNSGTGLETPDQPCPRATGPEPSTYSVERRVRPFSLPAPMSETPPIPGSSPDPLAVSSPLDDIPPPSPSLEFLSQLESSPVVMHGKFVNPSTIEEKQHIKQIMDRLDNLDKDISTRYLAVYRFAEEAGPENEVPGKKELGEDEINFLRDTKCSNLF